MGWNAIKEKALDHIGKIIASLVVASVGAAYLWVEKVLYLRIAESIAAEIVKDGSPVRKAVEGVVNSTMQPAAFAVSKHIFEIGGQAAPYYVPVYAPDGHRTTVHVKIETNGILPETIPVYLALDNIQGKLDAEIKPRESNQHDIFLDEETRRIRKKKPAVRPTRTKFSDFVTLTFQMPQTDSPIKLKVLTMVYGPIFEGRK